jgi:hypothetical protein
VRLLLLTALPACVVQEIDLRTPPEPPLVPTCDPGQRFIEGRGCVPCETMPPPLTTCPCGWWEFTPTDLFYCDTPGAYYHCMPCTGDIDDCNAYDPASGTSTNCFLLERCCEDLAEDPDSTPCCADPDILRCALDPGGSGALVGCLPSDCCAPACHPTLEVCDVVASEGNLVCVCNEVIAP